MNAEVTNEVEDYLFDRGQYGDHFAQVVKAQNDLEKN
jgi:hypothetical protein